MSWRPERALASWTVGLVLVQTIILLACAETVRSPEEVEAGRQLFRQTCSRCHGENAEGMLLLGKDLRGNEFVAGLTDEELVTFLQEGRRANHPLNERGVDMPPRGGNPGLSDDDLRQIAAYLRSLS